MQVTGLAGAQGAGQGQRPGVLPERLQLRGVVPGAPQDHLQSGGGGSGQHLWQTLPADQIEIKTENSINVQMSLNYTL